MKNVDPVAGMKDKPSGGDAVAVSGADGRTEMLVAGAALTVRLMPPASVVKVDVSVMLPTTVPVWKRIRLSLRPNTAFLELAGTTKLTVRPPRKRSCSGILTT